MPIANPIAEAIPLGRRGADLPEFQRLTRAMAELYRTDNLGRVTPRPAGGGITRLGKFEPLRPESRFAARSDEAFAHWLTDTLLLRLRLRQYALAALAVPVWDPPRAACDAAIDVRLPRRGWGERWRVPLKQKRAGLYALGEATALAPDGSLGGW